MYFTGTLVVSLKKRLVAFSFQGLELNTCVALVTCHCTNMLVVTPQHWKYACSWFPFKVWHIAKSAKQTLCKTPTVILFAYTDNFSIFDCIDLCVSKTLQLTCRAWLKHSAAWLWLHFPAGVRALPFLSVDDLNRGCACWKEHIQILAASYASLSRQPLCL